MDRYSYLIACLIILVIVLLSCRKPQTGLTWTSINSQTPYRITDIKQVSSSILYACSGQRYSIGEVIKSTDRGQTWTSLDSVSPKILNDIESINDSLLITAGFNGKVHRTFDHGQTWNFHQFYLWMPLYDITFVNDTMGWMAGGRNTKKGTIAKTNDRGTYWTSQEFSFSLRCITFTSSSTGYAGGYGKIIKTTDAGKTWQIVKARGDYYLDISFPTQKTGYAVGYNGSIIKTTDAGSSWATVKKGNLPFQKRDNLEAVAFINASTGYAVGRNGLIIKTEDGGDDWVRYETPDETDFKTIHLFSEHRGLVGGNHGWLGKFDDKGI